MTATESQSVLTGADSLTDTTKLAGAASLAGADSLADAAGQSIQPGAIGIFDSGIGGLTVAREIADRLPGESILYFGDTFRCPYGERNLSEVRSFVQQIGTWLMQRQVKLIVIACNTATAAGLDLARELFPVPVLGVVKPGARAAVQATQNQRVGVIATQATVGSGVYESALHAIEPDLQVFSVATPALVNLAESGIRLDQEGQVAQAFYDEARRIIASYLDPLMDLGIDTLVLGCTHFPLLVPLIREVVGPDVTLISSAEKTAEDVLDGLQRNDALAQAGSSTDYTFVTTAENPSEFARLGSRILGKPILTPVHVTPEELQALQ